MIKITLSETVTPVGYVVFAITLLSIGLAYWWLSAKKEKAGCVSVGLAAMLIWFLLMFPASISFSLFEGGTLPVRAAIIAFWIILAGAVVYIKRSKTIKFSWAIFLNVFFAIGGLMLAAMMGGMGYFVYLRLFTHEKDDAPLWAVFICIFFLSVLIMVIAGKILRGNKGNKDGKTEFNDLEEAKLTPDFVFGLDLSGQGFKNFPAEILKFENLVTLDLSNNQINTLPNDIARMKHLSTLKLSNNPISDQERALIRKMFPPEMELIFRT